MLLNLELLKNRYNMNINGVIHIGAHYGEEDLIYRSLNITNKIYIEPLKDNFNVLKNNVTKNSILYNIALGSSESEIEMYVETANNGQSSSILLPKLHLEQYPTIIFNKREVVQMKTLDSLNIDNNFNFINIDVQGYELEVFKGGVNTLKNVDYIMSEINRDEVYVDCAKIDQLIKYLSNFGFTLVEESWAGGTWGDGLFIKNKDYVLYN